MVINIFFPAEVNSLETYEKIYGAKNSRLTILKKVDENGKNRYWIFSKADTHKKFLKVLDGIKTNLEGSSKKEILEVIKKAKKAKEDVF